MNKFRSLKLFIPILLLMIAVISCSDNDDQQEKDLFLGCCSEEPVFGVNVNNLDQSQNGIISVSDIITPNGDGIFDLFSVANIENYTNHIVTVYDSQDQVVFESSNYNGINNLFPFGEQTQFGISAHVDGTYKYKIVVENEQTFLKSGTFCLFTNNPELEQQNFSECLDAGEFDPILTGF